MNGHRITTRAQRDANSAEALLKLHPLSEQELVLEAIRAVREGYDNRRTDAA